MTLNTKKCVFHIGNWKIKLSDIISNGLIEIDEDGTTIQISDGERIFKGTVENEDDLDKFVDKRIVPAKEKTMRKSGGKEGDGFEPRKVRIEHLRTSQTLSSNSFAERPERLRPKEEGLLDPETVVHGQRLPLRPIPFPVPPTSPPPESPKILRQP